MPDGPVMPVQAAVSTEYAFQYICSHSQSKFIAEGEIVNIKILGCFVGVRTNNYRIESHSL